MNTDIIAESMKLSFADTPLPKVVANLIGAGVRSYHADLAALRNTYYGADSDSYHEPLPLVSRSAIAATFDKDAVAATVRAIQQGECRNRRRRSSMARSPFRLNRMRERPAIDCISRIADGMIRG